MPESGTPSSRLYLISSFLRPVSCGAGSRKSVSLVRLPVSRSTVKSLAGSVFVSWLIDDRRARVADEAEHGLVHPFAAAEEAFLFACLQVHLVEERPRAFGRGAATDQVDRITVLEDRSDAVGTGDGHGEAGVSVGVIDAQVEQDLARFGGLREVDERRGAPAAVAIELGGQGKVFLGQPGEADKAMLDFHHQAGFGGERGLERHDLVAVRHFLFRVAAVERLGPDQPGVVQRLPGYRSRPGGHALAGDIVGDGQVGDGDDGSAARVPDLGLAREVRVWDAIGERAANRFHEQVFLVGGKSRRRVMRAAGPIRVI